jgi:hypothetical protein
VVLQVVQYMKKNHNVDVDVAGVGAALMYSSWMPAEKRADRLGKKCVRWFTFVMDVC